MKKKTVSEIYREWRNVKRHLVKESSFATYSINIERHILPAFGNCRTVDNDDAQALAFRLAADGLSANTVKGVMLVLRMLLEFGWRHGWAERPVKTDEARHSPSATLPPTCVGTLGLSVRVIHKKIVIGRLHCSHWLFS